jgi:aldose 1-epimerase
VSNEDITLTAGDAEVTVTPGNGGRIGSLRIGGAELLRQGQKFGCFPMVPWCGRIRDGRFLDGTTVRQMPLNAPPHAIHGTARDGAWRTARTSESEAVITYDLVDPWAQVGWHPWFNRNLGQEDVRVDFTPAWQEERGEDHLPTGRRIEPKPSPWDDCFGMPGGVDVTLTWPGQLELKVASREEWVVVYDEQEAAVCVEPQTGPPNGLNTHPRLVTPIEPLEATMTWSWRRL